MSILRIHLLVTLVLAGTSMAYTSRSEVARIDDDWVLLQRSVDSLVSASDNRKDGRDAVHELVFTELMRRDRLGSKKPSPDTSKLGERVADLVFGKPSSKDASMWESVRTKVDGQDPVARILMAEILLDKGAALVPTPEAIAAFAAGSGQECAPGISCPSSGRAISEELRTEARAKLIGQRIEEALASRWAELLRGHRIRIVPRLRPGSLPDKGEELALQISTLESLHRSRKGSYSRSLKELGVDPVPGCTVRFLSAAKGAFEAEVRCDSGGTAWRIDETGDLFEATGAGKTKVERFGRKVVLQGRLEREVRSTFDGKVAPIAVLRPEGMLVAKPGGRCKDGATARALQLRLDAAKIADLESLDGRSVTVSGTLDCSRQDIETAPDDVPGAGEDFLPLQLRGALIVR